MSESDMEALTNIIIEHKYGAAIYMSKVTTEENLRTAGISLVACRPFTPLVIIYFFPLILHRMIMRAYLMRLP